MVPIRFDLVITRVVRSRCVYIACLRYLGGMVRPCLRLMFAAPPRLGSNAGPCWAAWVQDAWMVEREALCSQRDQLLAERRQMQQLMRRPQSTNEHERDHRLIEDLQVVLRIEEECGDACTRSMQ